MAYARSYEKCDKILCSYLITILACKFVTLFMPYKLCVKSIGLHKTFDDYREVENS